MNIAIAILPGGERVTKGKSGPTTPPLLYTLWLDLLLCYILFYTCCYYASLYVFELGLELLPTQWNLFHKGIKSFGNIFWFLIRLSSELNWSRLTTKIFCRAKLTTCFKFMTFNKCFLDYDNEYLAKLFKQFLEMF